MANMKEMLGTKSRKEQEKRVERLLAMVSRGTPVITIAVLAEGVIYSVLGSPTSQDALQMLDSVREDILVAVAKQQVQQEQQPLDIEDVTEVEDLGVLEEIPPEEGVGALGELEK